MKNIKLIAIRINSDGDFYWDSDTYPKEDSSIFVYLQNPTTVDISNIIKTIANEFKEIFRSSKNLTWIRNEFYNELMYIADLNIERNKTSEYWGTEYSNGNYDMCVRVFDYIEKEVTFANTNEKNKIGMFDIDFYPLLICF